eukprot:TRINITY_DN34136_c0_g1_i1.p1 TRINITY_DN34136_c0_g1~~TRINITY_DN34136_c0_g1_i1.p1  ORF type:complete len:608 (-),score=70.20 TRINITY_DN34136_c0_g1_i1:350-1993(-)
MTWAERYHRFLKTPTLLWFLPRIDHAASAFKALLFGNLLISVLIIAGASNIILLSISWLSFVSTVNVGQRMLGYGWHPQLCEFGFLNIFLGVGFFRLWDSAKLPGVCSGAALWLLRFLLFRSLFEPGLGKIFGGDPSWWPDMDALTFHYSTQPCPNWAAWFMHALPRQVHVISCIINHIVESALPLLFLMPFSSLRSVAAVIVVAFMTMLVLTGNYAYLQYLMLAQAVPAFSEEHLSWFMGFSASSSTRSGATAARLEAAAISTGAGSSRRDFFSSTMRYIQGSMLVAFVLARSVAPLAEVLGGLRASDRSYDKWHLVNGYAAFSHMTKTRPEVIIEGYTPDEWQPVEFWCKVGDLSRRPCSISPLDLPIDWSLWFVPLGEVGHHPWFFVLLHKLLCRSPAILGAVRHVPMNMTAIRVQVYEYEFTSDGSDVWTETVTPFSSPAMKFLDCVSNSANTPWSLLTEGTSCITSFYAGVSTAIKDIASHALAGVNPGTGAARGDAGNAWWRRRFVRSLLPAVTEENLRKFLQETGLPSRCHAVEEKSGGT